MNKITINMPVTFREVLALDESKVYTKPLMDLIMENKNILIKVLKRNIENQQDCLYRCKGGVFDITETTISYVNKRNEIKHYSLIEIADLEGLISNLELSDMQEAYFLNLNSYRLILHSLIFIDKEDTFPTDLYIRLINEITQ